jgi:hypothetical protein
MNDLIVTRLDKAHPYQLLDPLTDEERGKTRTQCPRWPRRWAWTHAPRRRRVAQARAFDKLTPPLRDKVRQGERSGATAEHAGGGPARKANRPAGSFGCDRPGG